MEWCNVSTRVWTSRWRPIVPSYLAWKQFNKHISYGVIIHHFQIVPSYCVANFQCIVSSFGEPFRHLHLLLNLLINDTVHLVKWYSEGRTYIVINYAYLIRYLRDNFRKRKHRHVVRHGTSYSRKMWIWIKLFELCRSNTNELLVLVSVTINKI
jgi:hypothetical protein